MQQLASNSCPAPQLSIPDSGALARLYREKVVNLTRSLEDEAIRPQASSIIRQIIYSVTIYANDQPEVSIHASAREATWRCGGVPRDARVSIHASVREATSTEQARAAAVAVSIHASAREATPAAIFIDGAYLVFRSTPPRGRRPAF